MWCPSLLSSTHSLRALEEAGAGEADNGAQEDAGEGDAPGADDGEEHDGDAEEEDNNLQALPGRLPLRMRGKAFMLTYNWLFLGRAFPDGTPRCASVDDLWHAWVAWTEATAAAVGIKWMTSTLERSLKADEAGRVHLHWMLNFKQAVD